MGKVVNLSDDLIETIDLVDDDLVKFLAEIGVFESLRKKLGEGLDCDQRVANFVRHARRQIGPERSSFDQGLLFARHFLAGEIVDDRDRAEGGIFVGRCVAPQLKASGEYCYRSSVPAGDVVRESSASRRSPASLLPTASTGLFSDIGAR